MSKKLNATPKSPEQIDGVTTPLVEDAGETESEKKFFKTRDRIFKEMNELLPEIAEKLLKTLQARFENSENMKRRHPGMEWTKIQKKLEASPAKLWSLNEMERTGGEPDVVGYEGGEYIFMDCSAESPIGRRVCVYNKAAQDELAKLFPDETCNGNAIDMAAAMGVKLLTREEYLNKLQRLGEFDANTYSWIETPADERAGSALSGYRNGAAVAVHPVSRCEHLVLRSFRGSLRV